MGSSTGEWGRESGKRGGDKMTWRNDENREKDDQDGFGFEP